MTLLAKKKRGWGLKQVTFGLNAIVAKVEIVFGKNEIPKKSTLRQRKRVKRIVNQEITRLATVEKQKPNVVARTLIDIAEKERKKAMRRGDYFTAIGTSIAQIAIEDEVKKSQTQRVGAISPAW